MCPKVQRAFILLKESCSYIPMSGKVPHLKKKSGYIELDRVYPLLPSGNSGERWWLVTCNDHRVSSSYGTMKPVKMLK